jgi:hypothetical protein
MACTVRGADQQFPGMIFARARIARIAPALTTMIMSSDDHSNDAGLCAICGSAWPCPRADLDGRDLMLLCTRLREQAGSATLDT